MSTAAPSLPLQHFEVFHSRDVDEARECVARIFCPHRLATTGAQAQLDARHHSAPLAPGLSLNYVQYGAEVDICPGDLKDFYLLQIPLRGGAEVRCGPQQVQAHAGLASLPSPGQPLLMRWADQSPHLILRLPVASVRHQLEQLAQTASARPLVFALGVPLDRPGLAPALHFLRCLVDTLDSGTPLAGTPLAAQAEGYLIASLLLGLEHDHRAVLDDGARRQVLPRVVRRAQEYLAAAAEDPVSLADVCQHVGVSARALQMAFQRCTGQSPMAFLRGQRLERVRQTLQASRHGDGTVVAEVAARFGFVHLGHFAAQYKARFGEMPSQTLAHARQQ